jgi:hypothetical protein
MFMKSRIEVARVFLLGFHHLLMSTCAWVGLHRMQQVNLASLPIKKILGDYTNAWLWSSRGSCWWVHVHEWVYMHWLYALEVEERHFYMVGAVFRACWWLHGHTWGRCYPRSMDLVFLFFGMAGAHKWYQRARAIPYIYYICGRQCPISELRDYGPYIHQGILLRSWYVLGVAYFCEDMIH